MNSDQERQHLKTGIVEFDSLFQNKWEQVAAEYSNYTSASSKIPSIVEQAKDQFLRKLHNGLISESLIKKVDKELMFENCKFELKNTWSNYLEITQRAFRLDLTPGKNSGALYQTLIHLNAKPIYKPYPMPKYLKNILIITFLLFGVSIGIWDYIEAIPDNLKPILFILPFITILAVIYITRTHNRKVTVIRLNDQGNCKALLNKFLDIIAGRILKESSLLSSSELIHHAILNLENTFWKIALDSSVSSQSKSATGREIHQLILDTARQEIGYTEFLSHFTKLTSQYQYMKEIIIKVGIDIYNGHRVPSRYKKTRIQLVTCPQCAGPFATELDNKCPYCDSVFTRY